MEQRKNHAKKIIIICQFCWLVNRKWIDNASYTNKNNTTNFKQRGAGFSSLSFQEKPAAWYSKFFQASIGKHLNKRTNKQLTSKITRRGRQPFRSRSAASQRPRTVGRAKKIRSYHPEKKNKEYKPFVKRVCVDKYK